MRADRLVAALLVLQQRGRVTAAQLATELEVSLATARRDLEAMASAGIPVYPQPGRGGGWALVGGARTDLSGLTADEAEALFLLIGPAAGVSEEAKAALRKLVQALPHTFRTHARAAASATLVDPTRWGESERTPPEVLETLRRAVIRSRRVDLDYRNARGEVTSRRVDPWGVVDKDETWYLLAGTPRGQRTFRVERVLSAELTDESFERPDDLTLQTAWAEVVREVEARRSRTWTTVLVESRFAAILAHQFGRHVRRMEDADDGRSCLRLGAPTALDLARHLAGWGALVRVLDPPEVRDHLARIGAELVAEYAEGSPAPARPGTPQPAGRG
ncbi:YafY family transcriptional regulator [Ornithinimicrobium sp. F0845]|uniref:helix-turn-helix transcriptional regulator n=1 Tax=Ornithinimicrobium sp. F0845 TaxID=2926412 RepID=UPI001FF3FFDF|nr:YafY family protein [Ornithinimicrobium sp. F0845]MCK0112218.1 YafY family transcriptional regulator [Ornithinimicrobium sp. F0845]